MCGPPRPGRTPARLESRPSLRAFGDPSSSPGVGLWLHGKPGSTPPGAAFPSTAGNATSGAETWHGRPARAVLFKVHGRGAHATGFESASRVFATVTITLKELAAEIGAEMAGTDPELRVSSVNTLEDAGPGQVSFLSNAKYVRLL